MSRWFRHYAGMMRDEKLVGVAVRAKQPIERVIWVWGAILESAAEIDDGGRYEFDSAEAAYFLRTDEIDICAISDGLAAAGRVAEGRVVKWDDRQFQSDKSTARQAAYRERRRKQGSDDAIQEGDGDVTSPRRHVTPQETETETETETDTDTERREDARAQGHREISDAILKDSAFDRTPWEDSFLSNIVQLSRLTSEQKIQFKAIADRWKGKQANAPPVKERFYAAAGSQALEAWDVHLRKKTGRSAPRDNKGGWWFDTPLPALDTGKTAA